jgi:Na+/melibiose symporter-like transporter
LHHYRSNEAIALFSRRACCFLIFCFFCIKTKDKKEKKLRKRKFHYTFNSPFFFPKQKKKQKVHFKFSEDFFHFTALHENRRFRIASCFSLISQCYRMGLGAFPQAS